MGNFVEIEKIVVEAGSVSKWLQLRHTKQVVAVAADDWTGQVAHVEYSVNSRDTVRQLAGLDREIVCRNNRAEAFDVPGFVRLSVNGKTGNTYLIIYADPENELASDHSLEEEVLFSVGCSKWLPLTSMNDVVCVSCPDWSENQVKLELSFDGRFVFPLGDNGAELYCRQNVARVIENGGMVRMNAGRITTPARLTIASFNVGNQRNSEQLLTNTLMIDLLERKPIAKDYTVRQWSEAIGRSIGSVQGTNTWKSLMALREAAKVDRIVHSNRD